MPIDLDSTPRLAPGVRLGQNNNQQVLLMPERALRLNGPSLEIVQRCDGKRTVREIVTELQQLYSKADPAKVESDILGYLETPPRPTRPRLRIDSCSWVPHPAFFRVRVFPNVIALPRVSTA